MQKHKPQKPWDQSFMKHEKKIFKSDLAFLN